MSNSTKQKAIVKHLSPKITQIATRKVPFDEFSRFALAILEETCQKIVALYPDLPVRKLRDIVLEETIFALAISSYGLLEALQLGKTAGRVTLSANGESFLFDLRSEFPKE